MSKLSPTFTHADVELLQRERAYDGFFKLDRLQLRHQLFDGGWSKPFSRELFVRDEVVCVLPYDPVADAVLLIEQFRVGALENDRSPWLMELIAGIVEPGEAIEAVVHREADEEAGAKLLALEPICTTIVSPGGSQETAHIFCGQIDSRGLGGTHGLEHEDEDIRALVVPRQQAYQAVVDGVINNMATILALQWLQLNATRLGQQWSPVNVVQGIAQGAQL